MVQPRKPLQSSAVCFWRTCLRGESWRGSPHHKLLFVEIAPSPNHHEAAASPPLLVFSLKQKNNKHMEASGMLDTSHPPICFPQAPLLDRFKKILSRDVLTEMTAAVRPAPLIVKTQHPSSRGEQKKPIQLSNALLPSRKHQWGNIGPVYIKEQRKREKRKKKEMAAVKLLVKRARFTVSISTFSLCGSMEESVHFLWHQYCSARYSSLPSICLSSWPHWSCWWMPVLAWLWR